MFTKTKLHSLSSKQQHKHLAKQVRAAYLDLLNEGLCSLEDYTTYLSWLQLPELSEHSFEALSERYHWHLREAEWNLTEADFLPSIKHLDTPQKKASQLPYTVYLDNLRSAFNVGSIIRSAEAFGFSEVVLGGSSPDLNNKRVQATAMHTHRWIPSRKALSLESCPRPWIALELTETASPIEKFSFPASGTLIMGNEETGVSKALLEEADFTIQIPMHGRKNSLNVANSFAIAAYLIRSTRSSHEPST